MSLIYVLVLCSLFFYPTSSDLVNGKLTRDDDIEGYYWRNYKGVIPNDAFEAGLDVLGNISYVGQTLYNNLLVPGEIVASQKKMYYEWGFKEFAATENIKILCTQQPLMFQWVITKDKDFKTLSDKHFVPGGYEPDTRVYIGRTSDGKWRVGKVTVNKHAALHYVEGGKGVFSFEFEVLTTVNEVV